IDINTKNSLGRTALHIACMLGHADIMRILCNNSQLDPSIENDSELTAFDVACSSPKKEITKKEITKEEMINIFLSKFPNLLNEWGYETFLRACCVRKKYKLVRMLLNKSQVRIDLSKKKYT